MNQPKLQIWTSPTFGEKSICGQTIKSAKTTKVKSQNESMVKVDYLAIYYSMNLYVNRGVLQ